MKLPIHEAAFLELGEAIAYYEGERPGLGLELLDEVEATVNTAVPSERPARAPAPFSAAR